MSLNGLPIRRSRNRPDFDLGYVFVDDEVGWKPVERPSNPQA